MILAIIQMKVLSEKRMELTQTIASLSDYIRKEEGCQRCYFCQSIGDEDQFFLIERWDNEKNLMNHLKSDHFRVLRGAMGLLKEPYEGTFHIAFQPQGVEEAETNKVD
jgi:quinol monooxygenase YgiN